MDSIIGRMNEVIDIHTHIVPEKFPPYRGKGKDVPWPSMADAHACHKHVMISGKLYRTATAPGACRAASSRCRKCA